MKYDVHTVKRAIAGDKEAFEQLLYSEEEKLYYTALSYTVQKEDALDAIQEAVCKAYLSIKQLKQPDFFSTWLIRILIHECYRLLNKRQRMIPFEEEELLKKLEHHTDEINHSTELTEMLSQLNPSYQTALILFYYRDLPIKQISEVMEKPVGTIKTYLHRGKKQLREEMERRADCREQVI
ncbi:sigma-70 family RNA polymerase sigma factor [Ammoniphilus oxalaticus]|uniref:sigma-70 family RNA polymerase sigma factor n=1 Tax=Ammoniphilus oxalaticus TaxID=66863 RepID=UPI001FECEB48|nr:sigma-70 family RNA polymerase sigma factor [Ammoniphilus oxalaticus]